MIDHDDDDDDDDDDADDFQQRCLKRLLIMLARDSNLTDTATVFRSCNCKSHPFFQSCV